jgi:light-regulated signal transduction histidine kinase (bacteriophytochrome)
MEKDMLEQIQRMMTTATETLRQEMTGMKAELRQDMAGMKAEFRQEMAAMESRLGERIEETRRYSGVLAEDLHHKLDLVVEGQQFLRQQITDVRSDMDSQTRETRVLLQLSYRDINKHVERLEQRERP